MAGREGYHCARSRPKAVGNRGTLKRRNIVRFVYLASSPALAFPLWPPPTALRHQDRKDSPMADNPFAQPSALAFQLPPFDRIHDRDYLPAFEAGMAEQLTEVAAIAHNPAAAHLRQHHRRAGALRAAAGAGGERLRPAQRLQHQPADAGDRHRRWPPSSPHSAMRSIWMRRCGRASTRCTASAPACGLDAESLQLLTRYHTEIRARRRAV